MRLASSPSGAALPLALPVAREARFSLPPAPDRQKLLARVCRSGTARETLCLVQVYSCTARLDALTWVLSTVLAPLARRWRRSRPDTCCSSLVIEAR